MVYTSKDLFAQTRRYVVYGTVKHVRLVGDTRQFRNSLQVFVYAAPKPHLRQLLL